MSLDHLKKNHPSSNEYKAEAYKEEIEELFSLLSVAAVYVEANDEDSLLGQALREKVNEFRGEDGTNYFSRVDREADDYVLQQETIEQLNDGVNPYTDDYDLDEIPF